jgi:hypothetical protein
LLRIFDLEIHECNQSAGVGTLLPDESFFSGNPGGTLLWRLCRTPKLSPIDEIRIYQITSI